MNPRTRFDVNLVRGTHGSWRNDAVAVVLHPPRTSRRPRPRLGHHQTHPRDHRRPKCPEHGFALPRDDPTRVQRPDIGGQTSSGRAGRPPPSLLQAHRTGTHGRSTRSPAPAPARHSRAPHARPPTGAEQSMRRAWLRRADARIFAGCCRLLPSWYRQRSEHDMRATHAALAAEQESRARLVMFMLRESLSMIALAVRLRLPAHTHEARLSMTD